MSFPHLSLISSVEGGGMASSSSMASFTWVALPLMVERVRVADLPALLAAWNMSIKAANSSSILVEKSELKSSFSPDMIISEKIFGDCPLSSFTFDIYLGTSWTHPMTEEWSSIDSVSIQLEFQALCKKDVKKFRDDLNISSKIASQIFQAMKK